MVDEINSPVDQVAPATPAVPVAPAAPVAPVAPVAPAAPGTPYTPYPAKLKEPILSALLTFLLSGLGQIYNGQVKKGLVYLAFDFLGAFGLVFLLVGGSMIMAVLTIWAGGLGMCCCFPFMLLPFVWKVYFMYDAYKVANRINQGEIVPDWFQ